MTQEQIEELRALHKRGCLWLSEMRDGEPWVRNSDLGALLSLAAQAQRMREALEEIVRGGAKFDAKGTHTRAVVALARAALEQSDSRNVRDDEVRAKGPADRAPEAGEKPAQDE